MGRSFMAAPWRLGMPVPGRLVVDGQAPSKSPPKRCGADLCRPLHDNKAGALQMLHKPLGDDLRHDLVCIVDALAALVAERMSERCGKVGRVGGSEAGRASANDSRGARTEQERCGAQ